MVGWVNVKPLGKTDGRYGKLKIGGGLQSGDRNCDYTVTGAYIGYEYKKWLMNFEYSDADGYNGPVGYSIDKKASGFYSTLAYRFTPKVQGLLRYDQFDPNKKLSEYNADDFIWAWPNIDDEYFDDIITVFGHTPTSSYDHMSKGKILHTKTWIDVDVGVPYGNPPALLRLDDLKEFYLNVE